MPDARRVIVIETAWLPRVASTMLCVYQLPPSDFTLYDESAGYWISRQSIVPVGMKTIADPAGAIKERGAELRIMDRLWQLRDDIAGSSLDYSIIRMRNASG